MSIKEISAKEAKREYQKFTDAQDESKLNQIYGLIREECTKKCSIEVRSSLMNDTVSNKLIDLGYSVEENPVLGEYDGLTYIISWGKADV
jgi:hypothetical protein